ncbi:MAG: phosphotransferase [Candidatus Pelagadaptatus aseana]|uniref:aminoglycoside phosphotransferase family protein n=1 Tax=Candidatus Pelagadaptatus aseana TaxID=3120508 RepID=UPI0039B25E67
MNDEVSLCGEVIEALASWVSQQLQQHQWQCPKKLVLDPLGGDAGFRCYFRLNVQPGLLAVYAPPAVEKNHAFVALARHFIGQGVHAPEVVAVDFERGFLLLEDFGDRPLQDELTSESVDMLYGEVLLSLLRLQQSPLPEPEPGFELPIYDAQLLRQEMQLFDQWFVPQLLDYELDSAERTMLNDFYDQLTQVALQQPQVCVHRDFHSRNLMYREGQAPGVIDFQDAVLGPVTYDLVSLLRDCYVRWPRARVEQWALAYGTMVEDVGLVDDLCQQQWLQWFDWMGLQRHIKVLGIFARLWLRDGKSGYLNDLPLVIRYTLEVADSYPELAGFADWFRRTLIPLCEQQPWYLDYQLAGEGS